MSHDPRGEALPPDDAERDAWLREALRHAPDAAAAPPTALRESIFAQARAATASRSAMPAASSRLGTGSPFAAIWAWLARPPVASGFAGLMAATLVGLMWWDQPMDLAQRTPPSTVEERQEPARSSAPPPAPASERTEPPRAPAPGPTAVSPAPEKTAPSSRAVPAPAAIVQRPELKNEADATSRRAARSEAPQPQAFPPSDTRAATEAGRFNEDRLAKGNIGATAPAPATDPAPAAAPALPAPLGPAAELRSAQPSVGAAPDTPQSTMAAPAPLQVPAPTERQRMDAGDRQRMAGSAARAAAEAEAFATAPQRAAAAAKAREASVADQRATAEQARPLTRRDADRPLATLLASVASEPSRWSLRLADGASSPFDDATRRWLRDVDASTSGRWTAIPAAVGAGVDGAAPPFAGRTLVLLLDGRPAARFRISESALVHDDLAVDGTTRRWRSPLRESDAARLASTLPR